MKTKWLPVVFLMIASINLARSQGIIVPNGVTFAGSALGPQGYGFNVAHNPTGTETTGFSLDFNGLTTPSLYTNNFKFDPIVDVSVRVFLTSANAAITTNTLLSGSLTELLANSSYLFNNGVPVYLALYTGNENFHPPDGIYTDPLFGWAEVENVHGALQLLGGAMEYGGAGIFAGTQTIIQPAPEPGALALTGVGGLLFAWRRWRTSRG